MTARATLGRFTLLGTLYFAQGLPFGFFVQAVPVLLRQAGYSLSTIGLTTLLTLPWALKFTWAPIVDRVYSRRLGRRRTWILAMQLAATLVLGAITLVPGSDALGILMTAMLVLNLAAATQDVATDGLAIELLPPTERGFANGLQVAAYRVGMIIGGGVLLALYSTLGHHGVFAVMTGLTILASVPVLLAREPSTTRAVPEVPAATPPRVAHFLALPGVWRILALVGLYKLGDSSAQGMLKLFLFDHGLTLEKIGWISGTVGFVAGMTGALIGGALVGVIGRRRALIVFGLGQVVAVGGYAYLAFGSPSYVELYMWAAVEHCASGMATAALFTAMMDWSRPIASGTDYTVQASAVVIATGIGGLLGGVSADAFGYGPHFVIAASLCLVATFVAARLYPTTPFPPRPKESP